MAFKNKRSFKVYEGRKSKLERLTHLFFQQFIIISKMWWQVLLASLFTFVVVGLNIRYKHVFYMGWSDALVPILGLVVGLLLVFRTNTAYDRYYEGRRLWSQMTQVIRVLVRAIWTIVPEKTGREVVEKKSATNLLVAFTIASKHYLREEYAYDHKDLKELIHHFPQMFSEPRYDTMKKLSVLNYAPPSNIPLQILYYFAIFVQTMKERYAWDPATSSIFYNGLNTLSESLSGFERIKRTPIPPAYYIHLYHVIWLYILSLPFQLAEKMGWWTIAAVGITAFTFLGILEIGSQIEDPFGYDDNDLPLEDLCSVLGTEIEDILSTTLPSHEELFVSNNYKPIPNCKMSAQELSLKSKTEVRNLLQEQQHRYRLEQLSIRNLTNLKPNLTNLRITA